MPLSGCAKNYASYLRVNGMVIKSSTLSDTEFSAFEIWRQLFSKAKEALLRGGMNLKVLFLATGGLSYFSTNEIETLSVTKN